METFWLETFLDDASLEVWICVTLMILQMLMGNETKSKILIRLVDPEHKLQKMDVLLLRAAADLIISLDDEILTDVNSYK